MNNKDTAVQLYSKMKTVTKFIPIDDLAKTLTLLIETNNENNKVKKDIAFIESKTKLLVHEMTLKYDLYHKAFGQIFRERKLSIDKYFEIIDKGLKENNKELISVGLGNLSQVVTSSPFNNITELSSLLENKNSDFKL